MRSEEEIRANLAALDEDDEKIRNGKLPGRVEADYLRQNRFYREALKWVLDEAVD